MKKKTAGITIEEIREINREHGGNALMESNVESAIAMGKGNGLYVQLSYIVRALCVGHAYSDANKRSAFTSAALMLEKNGIKLSPGQKDELSKQIGKISKKSVSNIGKIRRMLEYAVSGK